MYKIQNKKNCLPIKLYIMKQRFHSFHASYRYLVTTYFIVAIVHTVTINASEQKVIVTRTVTSANVLLKKLLESGKHEELWPVAQNK
jgi:hypothetical protein